jgi:dienelactone hydrolase
MKQKIEKATDRRPFLIGISSILVIIISSCTNIKGEPVRYEADDSHLKGFIAYDSGIKGKRPGILLVHEWWGLNEYARKRAEMLAGLGYTALAVDMYGDGKQAEHPDEAGAFAHEVMQNSEVERDRFMAALELLKKQPTVDPERIAAIGYCFGGGVVLQMARSGVDLDGVVSFHGVLSTKEPAKRGVIKAKILVCHGEEDQLVTSEQMATFFDEMNKADADIRIITYKSAKHSFTNPDADAYAKKFNLPIGYNAEADKKSWADMQTFLKDVFK